MKKRGMLSKVLIALFIVVTLVASSVAIIVSNKNNQGLNSQTGAIDTNNGQIELNSALTINTNFGDGTVTGEFVIGGTATGSTEFFFSQFTPSLSLWMFTQHRFYTLFSSKNQGFLTGWD